jgi:hypothetical protein
MEEFKFLTIKNYLSHFGPLRRRKKPVFCDFFKNNYKINENSPIALLEHFKIRFEAVWNTFVNFLTKKQK